MAKKTWKLRALGTLAADTVRRAQSVRSAARELGLSPSTVSRAVRDGRLPAPGTGRPAKELRTPQDGELRFADWARRTYDLTRAEDELVTLAQQALDMANDPASSATVKLQAMAAFRATLRDLKLPTEDTQDGDVEKTAGRYPRPA